MEEHSSTAFQGMNERRKRGELCDFQIKVEKKTFPVHRLVLDTCSEYFRSMFASNMQESRQGFCELRDDEPEVVEICIQFMYTGELEINSDMTIKVLRLAHMWQLKKAVEICENHLCCKLSVTCCFLYWRLARLYGLEDLLTGCNEFIFSNTAMLLNSEEIGDISFTELEILLKEWKDRRAVSEATGIAVAMPISKNTQAMENASVSSTNDRNDPVFWKLCAKWATYKDNSTQFCKILEQYPINSLSAEDFIETVTKDKHIKGCSKCMEAVCKRFLGDGFAKSKISIKNCLILKDFANLYDCKAKHHLTEFILKNYKAVFQRVEFNKLVPPNDFVAYMKQLHHLKFSSEKFSVIASWIRFSPDRENIFPKLFQGRLLVDDSKSLFKLHDALFIKKLCDKYSCPGVQELVDRFITKNFTGIIKLPDALQMTSIDLVSNLQKLNSYGDDPTIIWNFIGNWINHNYDQRRREFPAIFQILNLEMFSFQFIRERICSSSLVKESTECSACFQNFLLVKIETQCKDIKDMKENISSLRTKLQDMMNMEERISNLEKKNKENNSDHKHPNFVGPPWFDGIFSPEERRSEIPRRTRTHPAQSTLGFLKFQGKSTNPQRRDHAEKQ